MAATIAIVTSVCTTLMVLVDIWALNSTIASMAMSAVPYTTATGVLAFLLSFRTSQAYQRFWAGTNGAYQVTGGLYMAACNLMAFTHHGNTSLHDIEVFKQTMVRLFSLASALMFKQMEGKYTLNPQRDYNILDLASLDMSPIRMLAKEEKKAEVVTQWVKVHIIKSINKGILSVPPPILTRVFQELDVSMGVYHEAARFSEVPFPFPYAATLDLLMILHTLLTPLVMVSFSGIHTFLPIPVAGVVIFVMWNVHLLPAELENPYDGDMNDLDLEMLQDDFNEKLKALCSVPGEPMLAVSAQNAKNTLKNLKRTYSQREKKRRAVRNMKGTMDTLSSSSSWGASFIITSPTMEERRSERPFSTDTLSSDTPDGSVLQEVSVMRSTTSDVFFPPESLEWPPMNHTAKPVSQSLDAPREGLDVADVIASVLGATSLDATSRRCRL